MKRKNWIVPILIALSLAVWGNNAYQIFIGLTRSDEDPIPDDPKQRVETIDVSIKEKMEDTFLQYRNDIRDPFQSNFWPERPAIDKTPKRNTERKTAPPPSPPSLRFCGVVTDSTGRLAILEMGNGESMLVREKDVVEGILVLSIRKDRIECLFGKQKFKLELTP